MNSLETLPNRSILTIDAQMQACIIQSIDEAEKLLEGSRPPCVPEIYVVLVKNFPKIKLNITIAAVLIQDMYRADAFYSDSQFTYYTTSLKESASFSKQGFEKFRERFYRLFPGSSLDKQMRVIGTQKT